MAPFNFKMISVRHLWIKLLCKSLNLNCKYEKDTIYGDPDSFHFKATGRQFALVLGGQFEWFFQLSILKLGKCEIL
jgi:hypothetical protein